MDLSSVIVARYSGGSVTLKDFLNQLKRNQSLDRLISEVIEIRLGRRFIEESGVTATDDELQKAADAFRYALGLERAEDMHRWLSATHQTLDDFEASIEMQVLRGKVAEKIPDADVERHFAENRTAFDAATVSMLVVEKEGTALELLTQVREEGAEFAKLAKKHSLDETASAGGAIGVVARNQLSPQVSAAIFNAKPGDVVGPVKTDQGYHLFLVEALDFGQLNKELADAIRQELLQQKMAQALAGAEIVPTIYEQL